MIVVGQVTSMQEAKEIESIHQICMVGNRARVLASSLKTNQDKNELEKE